MRWLDIDWSYKSSKKPSDLRTLPSVTWSEQGALSVQRKQKTCNFIKLLEWESLLLLCGWLGQAHLLPGGLESSAHCHTSWSACEDVNNSASICMKCPFQFCYLQQAPPWPGRTLRGCEGRGRGHGGGQRGPRTRLPPRPPHPLVGVRSSSGTRTNWGDRTSERGNIWLNYPADTWYDRHSPHRHTWTFHQYHSRKPWKQNIHWNIIALKVSSWKLLSHWSNNNKCTNFISRAISYLCLAFNFSVML